MKTSRRLYIRIAALLVLVLIGAGLWHRCYQRYQAVVAQEKADAVDAAIIDATDSKFYLDADGYLYYTPDADEIARDLERLGARSEKRERRAITLCR